VRLLFSSVFVAIMVWGGGRTGGANEVRKMFVFKFFSSIITSPNYVLYKKFIKENHIEVYNNK